jgi:hypothetical protein
MLRKDGADATGTRNGGFLANLRRLRPRVGDRAPHQVGGRRAYPQPPSRGWVVGARWVDTPGSHDAIRAGAAVMVRRAAHGRLRPGRLLGDRAFGDRELSVRDSLGVDRLRALVAEGHGSRAAILTRELNFGEFTFYELREEGPESLAPTRTLLPR